VTVTSSQLRWLTITITITLTMVMANISQTLPQFWKGAGRMFYIASPEETSFPDLSSLPEPYTSQAAPFFFGLIALEWLVLLLKGEKIRLNDGILSVVHGLIMSLMEAFVSGLVFSAYLYIHTHHCIYLLPWDNTITWLVAAISLDFCYYWVHRAAHEVNVLWAAHQVHHSSEDYNLTTALRQSAFQTFGAWPFYLPMAFFIPPTHAIVHKELNLLYQFWIHTEVVRNIGPLEYILNTASHHRVHHGANRYCLDKNYAGVLIIWDRMFGTFEAERDDSKIVYGLVDQPQFWNPVKHQLFYYGKVVEKARSMDNWTDFFFAFVKGPGWFPGTERLGDITFVPENPKREKYDTGVHPLLHFYTITHFLFSFLAVDTVVKSVKVLSVPASLSLCLYSLWSLTSIGLLYDSTWYAWPAELLRCTISLVTLNYLSLVLSVPGTALQVLFTGSCILSSVMIAGQMLRYKDRKQE